MGWTLGLVVEAAGGCWVAAVASSLCEPGKTVLSGVLESAKALCTC